MIAAVIAVGVLALVALLVSAFAGMSGMQYAEGLWPVIGVLPLVAFPIAVILILTVLIMTIVRRARGTQAGTGR